MQPEESARNPERSRARVPSRPVQYQEGMSGVPHNKPLPPTGVHPPVSAGRENASAYLAYLQSPQWRAQRNRAIRRAGYRCSRCESKRELQVHHLTYERLGHEWDQDLQVLCLGCHQAEHRANPDQTNYGVYIKLAREAVNANPMGDIADLSDAIKAACASHNIPVHPGRIAAALAVCGLDLKARPKPPVAPQDDRPRFVRPWSQAEARDLLSRLDAIGCVRGMPGAVVNQAEHERRLAEQIQQFKDVPALSWRGEQVSA